MMYNITYYYTFPGTAGRIIGITIGALVAVGLLLCFIMIFSMKCYRNCSVSAYVAPTHVNHMSHQQSARYGHPELTSFAAPPLSAPPPYQDNLPGVLVEAEPPPYALVQQNKDLYTEGTLPPPYPGTPPPV